MESIKEEIKTLFKRLPSAEQIDILKNLHEFTSSPNNKIHEIKSEILSNEIQKCPHCGSREFIGWGRDKKIKRFKCKSCKRTFTEYSGTWVSHIHHKDLLDKYVDLMLQEKSIAKISEELEISIQTSFDWRHKILGSIEKNEAEKFKNLTESDETFFLHSQKGQEKVTEKSRKRGGKSNKSGISKEQVAVIVTTDRKKEIELSVATLGRIKKSDIESAIGSKIDENTILCTDSHASYKGFAIDNKIEHHMVKAKIKEYAKDKIYHVQTVNSLDSRLKPWINIKLKGVATKYLQNYLNWFKMKETLKKSKNRVREFIRITIMNNNAWEKFMDLQDNYDNWMFSNA